MNFGMPGNPIIDTGLAPRGQLPVAEAHYLAVLALAAEQRTANLIAYAAQNPDVLVEGIDVEIRSRLGMPGRAGA